MANSDKPDQKWGSELERSVAGGGGPAENRIKEASHAVQNGLERTGRAIADQSEEIVEWIKARPVTGFAVGAALGAIIGALVGRHIR